MSKDFIPRFGPLDDGLYAKRGTFTYEQRVIPMNEKDRALTQEVRRLFKAHSALDRYRRICFRPLRNETNHIAMLTPPDSGMGYITFRDQRFWKFIIDVHNTLYDEIEDEDERGPLANLGINYAKRLIITPQIHFNPDYKIPESAYDQAEMRFCRDLVWEKLWKNFDETTVADIVLRAQKTTAIGYPNETVFGKPITRDDIAYGREIDYDEASIKFRRDFSRVKMEWLKEESGCALLFKKQMEVSGRPIAVNDINRLVEQNVVSVCTMATRENCPDAVLKDGHFNEGDHLFTKDRNYSVEVDGGFEVGKINSKAYNLLLDQKSGMMGAANRVRYIYPSNNTAHMYGNVMAKCWTHKVEHGVSGMPSDRPEQVARWRRFCDTHRDDDIYIVCIDRKNAETTITSNFELFGNLIDEDVLNYLKVTACTVMPSEKGPRVNEFSYCSAVWYTTFFHLMVGNYEGIKCIIDALNVKDRKTALANFYECLYEGGQEADLGQGIFCCPFLGTDDIMYPFSVPRGTTVAFDEKAATIRMVDGGFVKQAVAFGMKGTTTDLSVNQSSRLSKLFTSERMGFGAKDGMATYVRISGCGHTDVIDFCLKKHFGYGYASYAPCVTEFFQYLQSIGVRVEDVYNQHSPMERMLYGPYVSNDPVNDSSRVPDDIVARMYNDIKSAFRRI